MTLPGTGAVVAADDVSSAYFQRVKLDVGADGLSVPVEGALPVSLATAPLPTGAALAANQAAGAVLTGAVDETAPVSDTASSGLNGRLQRLAQRLTSLIALLPASLGQKAKANSLAVTLASDQDALPITDGGGSLTVDGTVAVSGTVPVSDAGGSLTVDGAVSVSNFPATQPVSGTVTANAGTGTLAVSAASLPLPAGAATLAKQPALGTAGTASADVLTVQGITSGTPLLVTSTPPSAAATPTRLVKTVAATGTPEAIAAASTFFQSATIIGNKAARTANTGTVYLGVTSADDAQFIAIPSAGLITVQAPAGQKFDLGSFYVDVLNAGDGVCVVYS